MQKTQKEAIDMNVGGIFSKIEKKLDWATLALMIYARYKEEGIGDPIAMATSWLTNIPNEIQYTLKDPVNRIRYKLLDAPHGWTGAFKIGIALWGANKLGLIDSKWGNRGEKIAKGAAIAALTLPGPHSVRDSINQNFQNAPVIGGYDY